MPNDGELVIVTLSDGTEANAYWLNGLWWTGVENSPDDAMLSGEVLYWRGLE